MPSYAWQLDDRQMAAVLTFVRNSWGNAAPAVSESAVKLARALRAGADWSLLARRFSDSGISGCACQLKFALQA